MCNAICKLQHLVLQIQQHLPPQQFWNLKFQNLQQQICQTLTFGVANLKTLTGVSTEVFEFVLVS